MMKKALIVHNPTSGKGAHTKKELLELVRKSGYDVNYVSTHTEDWKDFNRDSIDVIFVAGGDGTVNKLADVLIHKNGFNEPIPIHVLPLGTANNIARTLKIPIDKKKEHLIRKGDQPKKFSYGSIHGLKNANFFLESIGFGIFPKLILEMKEQEKENESPADELDRSLKVLLKIVKTYEADKVKIKFDGIKIKGSFLMVELMNIKYIGPNLKLAPHADPGDAHFDLVMIPEENRPQLEDYLHQLIEGKQKQTEVSKFARTISVKQVKMKSKGAKVHVDDEAMDEYSEKYLKLKVIPGMLKFFENV